MSVTKQLNSKSNIKQYSDADLPINPKQPVIARYNVDSTSSQTLINLPFQVDTVNAQDSFFVAVDGKILTLGSSNDYTMSAVDASGYSSQVTLNSPIVAGLNIQAWKLGVKKESEMAQDQRFTNLYESMDSGFQGFVKTNTLLAATSTTGAPAAGTFHSTVINRASIPDLTQDLKPRMGIERIPLNQLYQLTNEFGPNGEPVWGAYNDIFSQFRLVGNWVSTIDVSGAGVSTNLPASTANFIEITFYGTGLNLLDAVWTSGSYADWSYSVDGVSTGTVTNSVSNSTALNSRNYNQNRIRSVVQGLTLGLHTVRINSGAANGIGISGVEIINDSSLVKIQPGVSYVQGKKQSLSTQQSFSYSSPVTGTRGGRVLVYQKADGTIATGWQPTNASAQTFTSTDHTNEEVYKTVHFREFGAGRSDDFSLLGAGSANKAFTLDDGVTSLVAINCLIDSNVGEALTVLNGTGNFTTITFVGTGIDVMLQQTAGGFTRSLTYSIDNGASIGTTTYTTAQSPTWVKIASGLPYGTHTVKLSNGSGALNAPGIVKFALYQPKKPTLPSGAVELSDYNVMATFAANATAGTTTISTGVLRKINNHEFTYIDGSGGSNSWALNSFNTSFMYLSEITTDRTGYFEYTFFGTGFDLRFVVNTNRSTNIQASLQSLSTGGSLVNLNTTNFPTISSSVYGGAAFTASTGILNQNGTLTPGSGLVISNLPLGLYKVRFTNNSATNFLGFETLDIIAPVYSVKYNAPGDLQQSTPNVGSTSIGDTRKINPVKDAVTQKAWAQAVGMSSTPSTSSTIYVPMPDMSVTINIKSSRVRIAYNVQMTSNGSNGCNTALYIDGVLAFDLTGVTATTAAYSPFDGIFNLSPGQHVIQVYWRSPAGSAISTANTSRILTVEEQ